MYKLSVENEVGDKIELTNNPSYTIREIDGLYPSSAIINTTELSAMDGSEFNSSRVQQRNIVITLAIESPAEENRIKLYKYFKTRHWIKLYYENDNRNVFIEGYVETMPIQFFEMKQAAQISIICPSPYFKNAEENVTDFRALNNLFEFPFSIEEDGIEFSTLVIGGEKSIVNLGDVENGVLINLRATDTVLNPKIYNNGTGEWFILNVEMLAGDEITISTVKGKKYVKMLSDGVETNIIAKMEIGSTWFQLLPGDNLFIYDADEYPQNLICTFIQTDLFEGV